MCTIHVWVLKRCWNHILSPPVQWCISWYDYTVFQKCLNGTAKITLAACSLLLLWESCQSGGATHSAVQALMKHSVCCRANRPSNDQVNECNLTCIVLSRDRQRGVGGTTPYPPWGRSEKFTKMAKSRLFPNFFANLIQHGLNDSKMEFFSM